MTVGADREVCRDLNCSKYISYRYKGESFCRYYDYEGLIPSRVNYKIPEKCPYKNIHIIKSNNIIKDKESEC